VILTENKIFSLKIHCRGWAAKLLNHARIIESLLYLYRQKYHLGTDHSVLTWLTNFKNLEGQTTHWIQCTWQWTNTADSDWQETGLTSHQRGRPTETRQQLSDRINIRSQVPQWARHQDIPTDWPSIITWLSLLTLDWITLFLGDINMGTWPSRLEESQMRQ
jgi:hypothetical protein